MKQYFQRTLLVVMVVVVGSLSLWNLDARAGAVTTQSLQNNIPIFVDADTASTDIHATSVLTTPTPSPSGPRIVVTPDTLQAEHAGANTVTTQTFAIQNPGNLPLTWSLYEDAASLGAGGGGTGYSMFESDQWYVVAFSLTNPSNMEVVGPAQQRLVGLDFIQNDLNTLYGVDESARALVAYNLTTLSEPRVIYFPAGPAGERLLGNAWDQHNQIFYVLGTTVTAGCSAPRQATLYTLDLASETLDSTTPLQTDGCIMDLAVSPSGVVYAIDSDSDELLIVNPQTGAVTSVGPTGLDEDGMTIDFDDTTGELYMMSSTLYTLDLNTGEATVVGIGYRTALAVAKPHPVCDTPLDSGWLSVSQTSGTTPADNSTLIEATFDSTGLSAGIYTATLCIESNAIGYPHLSVPVTLQVGGAPATFTPTPTRTATPTATATPTFTATPTSIPTPLAAQIEVIPRILEAEHTTANTVTTDTLTLVNTGNSPLTWMLYEDASTVISGDAQIGYSVVEDSGWNVVRFSLTDPMSSTIVGPAQTRLVGLDFINNDFSTLYGIDEEERALVAYNLETLEESRVIHFPPNPDGERLLGNTWDQRTGTYYILGTTVIANCTPPRQASLYTLDLVSETLKPVVSLQTEHCITDIAMSPSGRLYASDTTDNQLVEVNTETGELIRVGPFNFDNDQDGIALDFDDSTGVLYMMSNNLYTVDIETGQALEVGPAFRTALVVAEPHPVCDSPANISWLSVDSMSGGIAPHDSSDLTVRFDSTGLAAGTYTGTLCIASNAAGYPLVSVPVTLDVQSDTTPPTPTPQPRLYLPLIQKGS